MLPTGTIGLEPIPTFLETAALPVKLCPINTHKPVEKRLRVSLMPSLLQYLLPRLNETERTGLSTSLFFIFL